MDLVKRTAHTAGVGPNAATGYGVIDPVSALTDRLPAPTELPNPDTGSRIPGRPHAALASQRARTIVFCVTAGAVALMAVVGALAVARRRREGRTHDAEPDDVDLLR